MRSLRTRRCSRRSRSWPTTMSAPWSLWRAALWWASSPSGTDEVTTVGPESPVEECMELMTERHIRHLPVVKDDQLVGVISIGDVVKTVIADLAALVDQLDSYIRGG